MTAATICGRRVKPSLIRLAGSHGLDHGVVHFQNGVLGAIAAVGGFVLALDDGEGVHDVGHGIAGRGEGVGEGGGLLAPLVRRAEVEMEKRGVQFATKQKAPGFIPAERRAVEAAVLREGFQVPSGVGQFENAGQYPIAQGFAIARPRAGLGVGGRWEDGKLLRGSKRHVVAPQFLTGNII